MNRITTVITAADNHALTTIEAVKLALGISIDETTTDTDALLAALITRASDAVRSFTGRTFAIEEVMDTFYVTGYPFALALSRYPVIALGDMVSSGSVLDAGYVTVDAGKGLLYRVNSYASAKWGPGVHAVTYTAGYLLPGETADSATADALALPGDLEAAVIEMIGGWYAESISETVGASGELRSLDIPGVISETYSTTGSSSSSSGSDSFAPSVLSTLMRYRVPGIA